MADDFVAHDANATFSLLRHGVQSNIGARVSFEALHQDPLRPVVVSTVTEPLPTAPNGTLVKTTVVSADAMVTVTTCAEFLQEPASSRRVQYERSDSLRASATRASSPPDLTRRMSSEQLASELKVVLLDPESNEPDVILQSLSRAQLAQLISAASKIISERPQGEDESEMAPLSTPSEELLSPIEESFLPVPEALPTRARPSFPALARSLSKIAATNRQIALAASRLEDSVKRPVGLKPTEIVVFGSVSMDLLAEVPSYPREGTTQCAATFNTTPGGKGANEAVGVAKLGVGVSLVGCIGHDDFGTTLKIRLSAAGVDIEKIRELRDDTPTGVAMIITSSSDAKKSTIPCMQANERADQQDVTAVEKLLERETVHTLLMQLEINLQAVFQAAEAARRLPKKVVVMVKASPINDSVNITYEQLWRNVDVLVVNEHEAPCLLEYPADRRPLKTVSQCVHAAEELHNKFRVPTVLVFTGFSLVCRTHIEGRFDVFVVPLLEVKAVDIIGAADAACAGFVSGRARGASLRHSLIWAMACGCISTMKHGAQVSLPDYASLCKFFVNHKLGVVRGPRTEDEAHMAGLAEEDTWPDDHQHEFQGQYHLAQAILKGQGLGDQLDLCDLKGDSLGQSCADFQGQTLLHLATLCCNLDATVTLLAHNAPVDAVDRYGLTPTERADALIRSKAVHNTVKPQLSEIFFCLAAASSCCAQAQEWPQEKSARVAELLARHAPTHGVQAEFSQPASLCIFLLFHSNPLMRKLGLRLVAAFLMPSVKEEYRHSFVACKNSRGHMIVHGVASACDETSGPRLLETVVTLMKESGLAPQSACSRGRTALHYAAEQGCIAACQYLMEALRLHMLSEDLEQTSPLQLCPQSKKMDLEQAACFRQMFISYGRDAEGTSTFVQELAKDLDNHGITSWRDTQDIDGGADWQKEISQALRQCKLLLVVLTQKWLNSQYCRAEYTVRRQDRLATPVLCIVPPTERRPVSELVAALGTNIRHEITDRQIFSFQQPAEYRVQLEKFCGRVHQLLKQQAIPPPPRQEEESQTALEVQPKLGTHEPFVLIADSSSGSQGFASALNQALLLRGFFTCFAQAHHEAQDIEAKVALEECREVILVLRQESDCHFLKRVSNFASERGKPIAVVPFTTMNVETGLDYAIFTAKSTKTFCFTDWIGHHSSAFSNSAIFHDIFDRFAQHVRETSSAQQQPNHPPSPSKITTV